MDIEFEDFLENIREIFDFRESEEGSWVYDELEIEIVQDRFKNYLETLNALEINDTDLHGTHYLEK